MLITFNLIALFIKTRHVLKTSQSNLTKGPWTQGLQNIFQYDKQVLLHRQSSDCTPSWCSFTLYARDRVNPSNSPSGRNSDARLCPSSTPKSIDHGSTSKSKSSHTKEDRIQGQTWKSSATVCGPVGGNSMSIHPIFLDVDTLTSQILFFFSLFVDNVEMINPWKF